MDLRLIYPSYYGPGHAGYPLEQSRTWFTHNVAPRALDRYIWKDFGTFRRYNTGDDSHWDEMQWRDGRIYYTETVDRTPNGQGWLDLGAGIGCFDAQCRTHCDQYDNAHQNSREPLPAGQESVLFVFQIG